MLSYFTKLYTSGYMQPLINSSKLFAGTLLLSNVNDILRACFKTITNIGKQIHIFLSERMRHLKWNFSRQLTDLKDS